MHIAICGELGAGCTEIGQTLSKKLGINCVNSAEVIKGIVLTFKEPYKIFERHVRSGEVDLDKMMDSGIDDLLALGDTIVEGRAGFMLLDNEEVFKVLLVAPEARRVDHIAKRRNITAEEAREAVRSSDTERKHMVERLFKKEWLDPRNYDIVINTGRKTFEETAELIAKATKKDAK